MKSHRVSIANVVRDIILRVSFPEVISNFGDTPVNLRPKAYAGYVELLSAGVIRMMQEGEDFPRPGVEFCVQPSPRTGMPTPTLEPGTPIVGALDTRGAADSGKGGGSPDPQPPPQEWAVPQDWAPPEADPAALESASVCAVQPDPEADLEVEPDRAADSADLKAVPEPAQATGKPAMLVQDIDLSDAERALHGRIRTMLANHEDMWSGEPPGVIKTAEHRMALRGPLAGLIPQWRPRGILQFSMPMGDSDVVPEMVSATADDVAGEASAITAIPPELVHAKLLLLHKCVWQRVNYVLRCLPPADGASLPAADGVARRGPTDLLTTPKESAAVMAVLQALHSLPVFLSGLGLGDR